MILLGRLSPYALVEGGLSLRLQVRALENLVEVVGLDGARSGPRRGVVALVHKGDREYPVALGEVGFVNNVVGLRGVLR